MLVESIKRLIGQDWRVVVRYIIHENNRVADMLAKRGRNLHMDSMSFAMPPMDMVRIVEEESRDSPQTAALSQLVEIVASFDPGGTGC
ncbi:hypothetical protein V6N12_007018 [Hibiscus sabdariffa]|uniref:RNase H type-1 domain-containing protein n=1 Tax=Hibiscus sabdariffa TaxID=183260 RepID=A0ABR2F0J4_9ROSI